MSVSKVVSPLGEGFFSHIFSGVRPVHEQQNILEREEASLLVMSCQRFLPLISTETLRSFNLITTIQRSVELKRNIELFENSSPRVLALAWNMIVSGITRRNRDEGMSILLIYYSILDAPLKRKLKYKQRIIEFYADILREIRNQEGSTSQKYVFPKFMRFVEFAPDSLKPIVSQACEYLLQSDLPLTSPNSSCT